MTKCLVTGATGLIGSHLSRQLVQDDAEVYALARHAVDIPGAGGRVTSLPIDLSQPWDMAQLPDAPLDAVIHLAQSEHFRDFPESAQSVFEVNTVSTLKLLDYARRTGVRTFILASTGGIYNPGSAPCSEDSEIYLRRDLGFYINSKLCSEMLVETYSQYLNVIILRFFFVYGPGQRPGMLIPRLVQSVQEGKPIQLQGRDGLKMNPTHVSDAAGCIRRALQLQEPHIINVGGPDVHSLREIGEIIGEALGKPPRFDMDENATPRDLVADISRMSALLGAPQVHFQEGIRHYIQQTCPQVLI